jgi:ribosome-binding factor A
MAKPRHRSSRRAESRTSIRGVRLEELFREELNSILNNEINDRRLEAASVTRVELSKDGSRARVWFTLGSSPELYRIRERESALERACGFLRARLTEALPLARSPQLHFRWDPASHDDEAHSPTETC